MKKVILAVASLAVAGSVYAACTTQTIIIGGKMMTCTTCCNFGNCTTTCI
jgi:archaellum component FlaG (FlaF/FlaG flagellin family)